MTIISRCIFDTFLLKLLFLKGLRQNWVRLVKKEKGKGEKAKVQGKG